jgi:hypothetical protein
LRDILPDHAAYELAAAAIAAVAFAAADLTLRHSQRGRTIC